jgi:uncharacterized protein YbjT (DUF2867 family)
MSDRLAFIAGATGATGRTLQNIATHLGIDCRPHVRTQSAHKAPQNAAVFDLSDAAKLDEALRGCTTVVQLIGTMRKRFASGDTYETSDIGTTQLLIDSALRTQIKHVILLSSVGAGRPRGAYLNAKAKAENIVTQSGIDYTIFRPSMFEGDYHGRIPGARRMTEFLGLKRYQPIALSELAGTILYTAQNGQPTKTILEAQSLWDCVAQARAEGFCEALT